MPVVTITEALRLAAASQLLLLVVLLLRDHRRSRVAPASALFVACVVCYLVLPVLLHEAVPAFLRHLARAGALSIPFAFWLTARLYFDDAFQPKPVHGVLFLGLLAARAAALPWKLAAAGIAMAVIADALRHIHAGASSDLLLSRLRLRYVVLLGTGVYALLVLVGEATVERGSRADTLLGATNDMGLFLLVAGISVLVMRLEPDLLRAGLGREAPVEPPAIFKQRLERLIEEEQIFKTEGLTIGALAGRLGEHEYKVRQLINAQLGFRNFGAFLNHFRVREARKLLSDPGQKRLALPRSPTGWVTRPSAPSIARSRKSSARPPRSAARRRWTGNFYPIPESARRPRNGADFLGDRSHAGVCPGGRSDEDLHGRG
jgi:AraC-like DNA-binding protein